MRHRITVRGETVELRGWIDDPEVVLAIAQATEPFGIVIVASPADEHYNPFGLEDM